MEIDQPCETPRARLASHTGALVFGDPLPPEIRRGETRTALDKNRRRSISHTVSALQQLYSFETGEYPDQVFRACSNPARVIEALTLLLDVMLPGRISPGVRSEAELAPFIEERLLSIACLLSDEIASALGFRRRGSVDRTSTMSPKSFHEEAERLLDAFLVRLPAVRTALIQDLRSAYEGDPAAMSFAEVQLSYPGLLAIASHRIAHELYRLDIPLIPRIMSEWTHSETGIDIHPGASIGGGFFIDHGTGVVIGETAVIGSRVRIYQGATLGARSFQLDEHGQPLKQIRRHPTIEDDVVIYSNAVILGGDTVIGAGSVIGSGALVVDSIPPGSVVTAKRPELRIKQT